MAFYSVNNLSVTQGNATVTGDETEFEDFIDTSWAIFIDKTVYFISSVDSQTQLTLAEPYTGPTKTNASYFCWPTQHLAVPLHIKTTDLIDTFGPLREDMNLLTQQITDTLAAQNVTLGYKQAVEIAKAAVDAALANAIAARDAAAASAATAAGHVVTTTNNKNATDASKVAAAQSAADAAAAKIATEAARDTTLGYKTATQTLRDQTQADKDATHTDKLATDANLAATIGAKNDTLTALEDTEDARDAAIAAKDGAVAARDLTLGYKNAAGASAQAADDSEAQAALSASGAATSKSGADTALNNTLAAKAEVIGMRDEVQADRDATDAARLAAEAARDLAEEYAQITQDPITGTAIIAALDYTPVNPGIANTFTADLRVPTFYIGSTANDRNANTFEMGGTNGSMGINVQDGTGRINHYWNSNGTASPTQTVANEDALRLNMTGASAGNPTLEFFGWDGQNKVAGTAITWTSVFRAGLLDTAPAFKGQSLYHSGNIATAPITTATQTALDGKLSLTGGTMTGITYMADTELRYTRSGSTKYAIDTTATDVRHYAYSTHGFLFQTAGFKRHRKESP